MQLELFSRSPTNHRNGNSILFVHGAYHAAWCWEEHFLDYFANSGYFAYALSLRGHGNSERSKSPQVGFDEYLVDIDRTVQQLGYQTILVGHSLGGMHARVVTPGNPELNGLGCIREVLVGQKIRYLEEIVAWSKPISFEYLIREASMPIRDYGSRLELTSASNGGTDIIWTSHYDIPIPIVGLYMKNQYEVAFRQILQNTSHLFDA
ncbi:alpha/beta fold hydrolase [Calothrix sp. PCC 6303]|uniref:alpha/beta fold hydrolase n=1 Tax=Calothrix sp. PCC 6303 TaxID=1170562 RepID=UPI0002A0345B|nr:alpha/beta fold hydrolase [Calothrix sp. PCC 6303]AFY99422.1 alpha/beta hydrolase fold protein [Calothrix sp. PCC 6303]